MKFGKLLDTLVSGNPEMQRQPLIRYKQLKKQLKRIHASRATSQAPPDSPQPDDAAGAAGPSHQQEQEQQHPLQPEQQLSADEATFVAMLNEDLTSFNTFFMEREEEAVIKLQALADSVQAAGPAAHATQVQALKAALVDFHGEMVLLLHWSLLNYAALAKILKKHDKQSGMLLRAPFLANVLHQPFYSTNIMSRLVKMAEEHIDSLVTHEAQRQEDDDAASADACTGLRVSCSGGGATVVQAPAEPLPAPAAPAADAQQQQPVPAAAAQDAPGSSCSDDGGGRPDDGDAAAAGSKGASRRGKAAGGAAAAVCARTRMALQTWQQLRSNASTPSTVLPADSSEALAAALQTRQRWSELPVLSHIMRQSSERVQLMQQQQEERLAAAGGGDDDRTDDPLEPDQHAEGGGEDAAATVVGRMGSSKTAGSKHPAGAAADVDDAAGAASKRQRQAPAESTA